MKGLHVSEIFQLSFDPAIEREFRFSDYRDSIKIIRFGLVLGIILYGVFGVLDAYMLPLTMHIAWTIRFAFVLPVLVVVLIWSYRRSFVFYSTPVIFVTSLILGFGILGMIYFARDTESGASVYYTGLMLVIIWIGTFSQLRFKYAAWSIALIIVGFILVSVFRQDMTQGGFDNSMFLTFVNNSFFFISSAILAFVSAYSFERSKRNSFIQRNRIELEKRKSDKLLLNILPDSVAEEIKSRGTATPEVFPEVTVMIADIVGFTEISSHLEPEELVSILNEFFTACDNIIEVNNCERIKTIGDAYLAVSGMPRPDPQHAANVALSALQIIQYCKARNLTHTIPLQLRIGIHTGKVVGAVVGVRKYIYDVFGATINIASRMQSHSEPMKINITEATQRKLSDRFHCSAREVMPVKGIGKMKMYFLECSKESVASLSQSL